MHSKRQARIAAIREIANDRGWRHVDGSALAALQLAFPDLSVSTLRHDLRETGLELHPLVEGVRLDDLEHLARTLLALNRHYTPAHQYAGSDGKGHAGKAPEGDAARQEVLAARRKAEFVIGNPRVDAAVKVAMEEKLLWLRVWLENPLVFPHWLTLRQATLRNQEHHAEHPSS